VGSCMYIAVAYETKARKVNVRRRQRTGENNVAGRSKCFGASLGARLTQTTPGAKRLFKASDPILQGDHA
jgi:hypothetical protein